MKPLNPWEEINRLRKVVAIVDLLDTIARAQRFDPHVDADAIAEMLRGPKTTPEDWVAMAVAAGQYPPSKTAIAEIIAVYDRRALAANDRAVAS